MSVNEVLYAELLSTNHGGEGVQPFVAYATNARHSWFKG
jgi:hypothetical protein